MRRLPVSRKYFRLIYRDDYTQFSSLQRETLVLQIEARRPWRRELGAIHDT